MTRNIRSIMLRYGLAVGIFAVLVGISLALRYAGYSGVNLAILIIIGLAATAWYAGRGPGILLAVFTFVTSAISTPPAPDASVVVWAIGMLSSLVLMVFIVWLLSRLREAIVRNSDLRRQNALLLNSVGEGIFGIDSDGKCTFVNPAAADMIGWETKDLVGKTIHEILHHTRSDGAHYPAEECPVSASGKDGELRHITDEVFWRKDGASFPVEYTSTPLRENEKVIGAVTVFRDKTKERQAENKLRQQAILIDQSHEAIFVWDFERGIVGWNAGSERLYGYTKEEAEGRMDYDLLATVLPLPFDAFLSELRHTGSWTGEIKHRAKDGREVISASRYQVVRMEGRDLVLQTNRDITDEKRAEAALLDSEARYRHLFDNNPLPMWVYDLETLAFLAVNDSAVFHYGYSREEFLAMTIKEIRPQEDIPALLEDLNNVSRSIQMADGWRHQKKDGTVIDVEITSHELDFDGRKARLVLANDITERKKAEADILHLNETLEERVADRTARLEALNKELESFSYSVSHDLRAPLRAIDGFARIFAEDHGDKMDDEGKRLLSVIRTNARSMGKLIDDLLAFSRLGRQPVEQAPVDMTELAHAVRQELRHAGDGSSCPFKIDPLPNAFGDRALLRQVLVNLFSNAVKYSSTKEDACVEVGSDIGENENVYFVRDNGVGFDMNYSNKLFGVFQRLHGQEEFEGTGVGLAIVQRVIQRHGGRVWAEGEVNKGATFYFALPTNGSALRETDLNNGKS
jgi:PAS domain S-box-containing protein